MLLRRLSTTKTKRLETKLNFMKIDSISNKVFLGRVSSVIAITLMALAPSVIKLSEMEIFRLIFWRPYLHESVSQHVESCGKPSTSLPQGGLAYWVNL